ncbi:MAG: hypothetical protein R3C14_48825 [Caldilineaceae bacterium]
MRSIKELVHSEVPGQASISIRSLLHNYGVGSLVGLIAAHDIDVAYRTRAYDRFGPLGEPIGGVFSQDGRTYKRDFQLGSIIKPLGEDCKGSTKYKVYAQIAGIRCYGTDDPGGTDEPYLVATLININPMKGEDQTINTKLFGPFQTRAGQTFCKAESLGEGEIPAGTGIRIHMALFDKEGGNHEEVREDVEEYIREAVKTGAVAIATAVGAGDINTASSVAGDALNSKPARWITAGLSHAVADIWADDFLGEKVYHITASDIQRLSTSDSLNVRNDPGLDPDVVYNFPKDPNNRAWLFDEEGATYRVYVMVQVSSPIETPCF